MIGMLIVNFNEKNDISVIIISIYPPPPPPPRGPPLTWNQDPPPSQPAPPDASPSPSLASPLPILKKDQGFIERKKWCKLNTEGKWIHCEHGYFDFRKKTDAMAFKLRSI